MKTLAFASIKGGAGKSTLAASIAVAAAHDGQIVVILDTDEQRSLMSWHGRRGDKTIGCRYVEPRDLRERLGQLRTLGGISLVILDTPGRLDASTRLVLREADLIVVPCRPATIDLEPTALMIRDINKNNGGNAIVALNQCPPNSQGRSAEAQAVLRNAGASILTTSITTRIDHQDAFTNGEGVTEYGATRPAATEIGAVWNEIKSLLKV